MSVQSLFTQLKHLYNHHGENTFDMFNIFEHYQQNKAKKLGIKLSSIHRFRPASQLQIESHCRLSEVVVDLPVNDIKKITIGAYSYIRSNSELLAVSEIGRFCSIGRNVTLGLNPRHHPIDWVSTSEQVSRGFTPSCKPLKIGHDVWIGHNAIVMAGISIGNGAIIGCNAVVTKDVAPYQIVAGNPAKLIRYRFSDIQISILLNSQWWEYDITELHRVDFKDTNNLSSNLSVLEQKANYSSILIKNKKITAII